MEASLLDMTRGHEIPVFAFTAIADHHDDYDVVIEWDAFSEPWFAVPEDSLAIAEEPSFPPIATRRSLHAVLGFATAVGIAACLYAATL